MKHFTMRELCRSTTATAQNIYNEPTPEVRKALHTLVTELLDPLREILGEPIIVSSGYRSPKLNRVVGGVANSQHVKGEAVDIVCRNNRELFELIRKNFVFDQLIDEYNLKWIHVSYCKGKNRKQVLKIS